MHVTPEGKHRPIAFASRSLNKHEKCYSQIDKEALAIMFGLKRFRMYLYGRDFTIWTDHKHRYIPSVTGLETYHVRWLCII